MNKTRKNIKYVLLLFILNSCMNIHIQNKFSFIKKSDIKSIIFPKIIFKGDLWIKPVLMEFEGDDFLAIYSLEKHSADRSMSVRRGLILQWKGQTYFLDKLAKEDQDQLRKLYIQIYADYPNIKVLEYDFMKGKYQLYYR